jgi:putative spermidine/putrescine transport system substrate-binding protein
LIVPWDLAQIPNYSSVWEWAKHIRSPTFESKTYGIPTIINADSMVALRNKVGNLGCPE